ncbi:protein of unknown function [Rhodovastum atsumiense]|nr:protein of unknown function [Rhodovastum atsumiense]
MACLTVDDADQNWHPFKGFKRAFRQARQTLPRIPMDVATINENKASVLLWEFIPHVRIMTDGQVNATTVRSHASGRQSPPSPLPVPIRKGRA